MHRCRSVIGNVDRGWRTANVSAEFQGTAHATFSLAKRAALLLLRRSRVLALPMPPMTGLGVVSNNVSYRPASVTRVRHSGQPTAHWVPANARRGVEMAI